MLPMVRQAHHESNSLKILGLILSLSKDEARISRPACQGVLEGKRHG